MEAPMTDNLNLPEPIAAYFTADQRNGDEVARCFTTDAVVKDEGRTYTGAAAIKQWKEAASAKYTYSVAPFDLQQRDGLSIVTSRVIGNFPRSPVDLRYAFRLERGKIASLEITA
jgi:hypothetical protein